MALRPFCLILQYSYPLSCSRWRAVGVQPASQPGSLPTVRIVFPEPDFGRNINSRFAKDLDAYQDALAVKAMQGNDRRGA